MVYFIVGLISLILGIILGKTVLKGGIQMIPPNAPTMDMLNHVIVEEFIKVIHKHMVGLQTTGSPVKSFINEMSNTNSVTNFVATFVLTTISKLSPQMVKIYYLYRKNSLPMDKDTPRNDIAHRYSGLCEHIAEMCTVGIRVMCLEFATLQSENPGVYSVAEQERVNSKLFVDIERRIYDMYGFSNKKPQA